MARSNTANGGTTYVDLDIQVVSMGATTVTLRAVVYLTSRNVTDTTNNLSIGGNWSRSGAMGLGGVYNANPIWSQDIVVGRGRGYNYDVSVSMSWSAVEYWGTTLSASQGYTVPAYYDPPSAPPTGVQNITPTSATIVVYPSADGGGAGIVAYEAYVMTNNAWPGQGGNVVASASGGTFNTGNVLVPSTVYYYTARALNGASLWSGWTPMQVFTTQAAARMKYGGQWTNVIPYVKHNGVWKQAIPYVKKNGVWVQAT